MKKKCLILLNVLLTVHADNNEIKGYLSVPKESIRSLRNFLGAKSALCNPN